MLLRCLQEEAKQALYGAIGRALESYERGRLPPAAFSTLLEQLQVVLEAEVAATQEGYRSGAPGPWGRASRAHLRNHGGERR